MCAKVGQLQIIYTDDERRGKGCDGDPIRRIANIYLIDGTPLLEFDPELGTFVFTVERYNALLKAAGIVQ